MAIGTVREAGTDNSTLTIPHEAQLWPSKQKRALFLKINNKFFPDGTPTDGLPIVNIVTVNLSIVISLTLLGITGIVYTLICMIFNFIYRQKK